VSKGDQRRLYDQRRQMWANANNMRLVILDYRGFETDKVGRLLREPDIDRHVIADALRAAGVIDEPRRRRFDMAGYMKEVGQGCFLCRLVKDDPTLPAHHVVWRNKEAIIFTNRFPTVYGYLLVAPVAHLEQISGDFSLHQYLALQRVVYATAEAVRLALAPERVYVLSLGSQQANAHVHWHIVPCPPGVPFDEQQLALVDVRATGVLEMSPEEGEELVSLLRDHLPAWMQAR
jgi:diadenosine tetraphosphate (Ap4A) HIT family hydrolase